MLSSSFLGLLNNAILLLALGVVYDSMGLHNLRSRPVRQFTSGVLIGLLALAVMSAPWELQPGIFFDTRWILISLCGLFFGLIPTLIAVLMAVSYRLFQGGGGQYVGSLVIIVSAFIGLGWGQLCQVRQQKLNWFNLLLFSVVVELGFLACMLLMPEAVRWKILEAVAPTALLLFPPVSLLMAMILRRQQDRRKAEVALRKSREALGRERGMLRGLIDAIPDLIYFKDSKGRFLGCNPAFSRFVGRNHDEVTGLHNRDLFSPAQASFYDDKDHEALKTELPLHYQNWADYPDGSKRLHDTIQTRLFDARDNLLGVVGIARDATEKHAASELIWKQANFDSLTGLPNRNMLKDRLEQGLRSAKRTGKSMALLFLDLDDFKGINDTLGHNAGDLLLKEAANRLADCVRETDTIARISGDEFTIVLNELDCEQVIERVARTALDRIARPFEIEGDRVYISVSIGITLFPQDADDVTSLLRAADQAMYEAKRAGRNRFHYFTPAMQEAALKRMQLSNELRHAAVDEHFQLLYQPIVQLSDRSIRKAEALLRWHHPQRGMVSPLDFIPIAEDTGLIVPIGDWVFRTAADQVTRWRQQWGEDFQISVNCSPVQFADERHTPIEWQQQLQRRGLGGDALVIEITEGLLMDASELISDKLHQFAAAGMQVALDDFGTGYSSLAYLKRFDIDYLKIDRAFVRNLSEDSEDLALCEAMIVMAHRLGIRVIAEGIETEEQMELLRDAGCDYGQGFLFAKPLPADQLEALLEHEPAECQ